MPLINGCKYSWYLSPDYVGAYQYALHKNLKFLGSDTCLVNRVFGGTGQHPALIPTEFSSKFVSPDGRWRVVGTSLLLATVERSLNYYLWELVCGSRFL